MIVRPLARPALLLAAVACLLATPVRGLAQAAPPAASGAGWWAGAGGGYLAGRASCTNCESDPPFGDGYALIAQGGVRINPQVNVGAELFSTTRTDGDVHLRDTYLLGIAQFRPLARHGFFLKLGYGMALVKEVLALEGGETTTSRTWGMGLMYGAGWVFRESHRVSIAPWVGTYVTTVGNIETTKGVAENVVINSWFVGAALMFR